MELSRPTIIDESELVSLDIYESFPDTVCVLHYPQRNTCICLAPSSDINALACFSTSQNAADFCQYIKGHRDTPLIVEHSFDEARELAKSKEDVTALMLADDVLHPIVHYIR